MPVTSLEYPLSIRGGALHFEDCAVHDLAKQFGTPVFAVSETQLRSNFRNYSQIYTRHWPEGEVLIMPSIKANPNIAVRRILSEEGAGCDVFGFGELECALRGNVAPEKISVNGSIKDRELVRKAIDIGAHIVLDSPRELDLCEEEGRSLNKRASISFRLKPDLSDIDTVSDYVPEFSIRFMTQVVKYGIPTRELMEMAHAVRDMQYIDPVGIHVHMGRHSKRPEVWRSLVRNTVKLIAEISKTMDGWTPQIINLGGGMPSRFDLDTDVTIKGYVGPTPEEMAVILTSTLRSSIEEFGMSAQGIALAIEPGRAIHCDTGIHIAKVCNLKNEQGSFNHRWAEIDSSQMFLGVGGANFDSSKFEFLIANKADKAPRETTDIVGMTCNLEVLFYQVMTPDLEVDDIVTLLYTGSYIEPCAQNFNALPRPGMILVKDDIAEWIKRPETVDDVLARDVVPERI